MLLAGQTDSPGPKVTSLAVPVSLLSGSFLGLLSLQSSLKIGLLLNCCCGILFSLPVKGLTDYLTVIDLHNFVMEGHW